VRGGTSFLGPSATKKRSKENASPQSNFIIDLGTDFAQAALMQNPRAREKAMRKETSPSSADTLDTVPDTSSPAYATRHPITRAFDTFASAVTRWTGSPMAFGIAVISILAWAVTGPIFQYSENWQLVINTGTTIVTFVMVFLIQQSQNKDSVALHLKLNELLASHRSADNHLIGIEDASEEELRRLAAAYLRLTSGESKEALTNTSSGAALGPSKQVHYKKE
jgi:low affinity Fe/Cu permease